MPALADLLFTDLTRKLGFVDELPVRHWRHALVQHCGDVTRIMLPWQRRDILNGRPRLDGHFGFFLTKDLAAVTKRKFADVQSIDSLALAPFANFPLLSGYAYIDAPVVSEAFCTLASKLMRAMPSSHTDVAEMFGPEFFAKSRLDRLSALVKLLRNRGNAAHLH